jgi:hypothetical protein
MKISHSLVFLGLSVLLATGYVQHAQGVSTGRTDIVEIYAGQKIAMSAEGGLLNAFVNQGNQAISKGYLVHMVSSSTGVSLTPVGNPDPIGAMYDTTCAVGATCWVVTAGVGDVYYGATTTYGQFGRMTMASDDYDAPGVAIAEPMPTSPFATDKHFMEIGHILEARGSAGLAKTAIHFN